jgi:hypothetical protein
MAQRWHWLFPLLAAVGSVLLVVTADSGLLQASGLLALLCLAVGSFMVARGR